MIEDSSNQPLRREPAKRLKTTFSNPYRMKPTDQRPDPYYGEGIRVILHNDDTHAFADVVRQVMNATGCDINTATAIVYRAHTNGSTTVTITDLTMARWIGRMLLKIQLDVTLEQV